MIDGCLAWQKEGLKPLAAVRDATIEYLDAQDAIGQWINERCKASPRGFASNAELFRSWSDWATKAGEIVGSQRDLTEALEGKGYARNRASGSGTRGFRGLYVVPQPTGPGW
jgi:putative DNA primase/helicase